MQRSQLNTQYDVVISGMGGAGLCAAWEECFNAYNESLKNPNKENNHDNKSRVLIISDRLDKFVLRNIIKINTPNMIHLENMRMIATKLGIYNKANADKDDKFSQEFEENNVSIKSIEQYVKRRLDEFKHHGVKIDYAYESTLTEVDLRNGLAKIGASERATDKKEEETVQFNYLIGADGYKRHALKLVSQQDESIARLITFEKDQPLPHSHHFTAYLVATRKDGLDFSELDATAVFSNAYLKREEGVDYESYIFNNPYFFDKTAKKQIKFSLTGELPDRIYQIKDEKERKAAILNYAQDIVEERWKQHYLGQGQAIIVDIAGHQGKEQAQVAIEVDKTSGITEKDKLKVLAFKTNISEATQAAVEVGESDKKYFLLIGDAFRDPNYKKGSGMNDAIQHTRLFGKLRRGEITLEQYNKSVKDIAKINRQPALSAGFFDRSNKNETTHIRSDENISHKNKLS